jgi:hypothetical protein
MRFVTDELTGERLIYPDALRISVVGKQAGATMLLKYHLEIGVDPAWLKAYQPSRPLILREVTLDVRQPSSAAVLSFDVFKESGAKALVQLSCAPGGVAAIEKQAMTDIRFFHPSYRGASEEYHGWLQIASGRVSRSEELEVARLGSSGRLGPALLRLESALRGSTTDPAQVADLLSAALNEAASFERAPCENGASPCWQLKYSPSGADRRIVLRQVGGKVDLIMGDDHTMSVLPINGGGV